MADIFGLAYGGIVAAFPLYDNDGIYTRAYGAVFGSVIAIGSYIGSSITNLISNSAFFSYLSYQWYRTYKVQVQEVPDTTSKHGRSKKHAEPAKPDDKAHAKQEAEAQMSDKTHQKTRSKKGKDRAGQGPAAPRYEYNPKILQNSACVLVSFAMWLRSLLEFVL